MKSNLTFLNLFLIWLFTISAHAADGGVESLRKTSKAFASVAREVSPSVVFIQVETKRAHQTIVQFNSPFGPGSPFGNDEFFKHFLWRSVSWLS